MATHITTLGRSPAEIRQVCQLFETVFHHPASPDWWAWKYQLPPRSACLNLVARTSADGELLGHVGAVVLPGEYGGQKVRMAHLTDVMVHPRARGGLQSDGLYGRLMAAMREQLHDVCPEGGPLYAYGFPGRTPSRLGARMKLYRPLYTCREYRWHQTPVFWLDALCRLRACSGGGWPLDRLDRLWTENASQLEAPTVIKDGAYMQWRYANHPQQPYVLWLVRPLIGAPVGWIVTRQRPRPMIVDALLPKAWRTAKRWHGLLRALVSASGHDSWAGWLPVQGAQCDEEPTMIVAVEFDAGGFHVEWAPPQFQPGDTDVF